MAKGALTSSVLYLSHDGLTDPLGQSQVLPYLTGLAQRGHTIAVISFEKRSRFQADAGRTLELCLKHNISWTPLEYHQRPAVIATLYDLLKLWRTSLRQYRTRAYDIVHCRSYVTSLVGIRLKRKLNVRYIFDMRGFWPDERIEGGIWSLANPVYALIYKYFKRWERIFLHSADHVVTLTNAARKILADWSVTTPVAVIPCCVNLQLFDPGKINDADRERLRSELGIRKGQTVLIYIGSWGSWYQTDEMLDFFTALKTRDSDAKLLIISQDKPDLQGVPFREDVVVRAARHGDVPLYESVASAGIMMIKPVFSKKGSSATKLGELLAMNIPVVTNRGWGDIEEIAVSAGVYFADDVRGGALPTAHGKSRAYCLEVLDLAKGIQAYHTIYQKLTNPNRQ